MQLSELDGSCLYDGLLLFDVFLFLAGEFSYDRKLTNFNLFLLLLSRIGKVPLNIAINRRFVPSFALALALLGSSRTCI